MEKKENIVVTIASASTSFITGYAQHTGQIDIPKGSSIKLLSVHSVGRLLQGAKEFGYHAPDFFYNSLTPTPYYIPMGFTGAFWIKNKLTTNNIVDTNFNYTSFTGTSPKKNDGLHFNFNFHYIPIKPIDLICEDNIIGIDAYWKWHYYSGFSYYDSANIMGTAELLIELLVTTG